MTDTPNRADATTTIADADATTATIAWLEAEFPGWTVEVDETATWEGSLKSLWIARQEGHHPQAELTAAKLHTRLSEYLDRSARRQALSN